VSGDVLVVTDGEVPSWQSVVDEAKQSGRRVFTVGVGSAVSEVTKRLAHERGM
jgi:Ca-activated chloride channel family protein